MRRMPAFVYGGVSYAIFFGTFLYAAGFVGNLVVPKSLDSAPVGPLGTSLLINLGLLGLFAVQHSVMARPAFKRVWTQIVPEPIERALLLSGFAFGWLLVLVTTFPINRVDLFGLRQFWLHLRARRYRPLPF